MSRRTSFERRAALVKPGRCIACGASCVVEPGIYRDTFRYRCTADGCRVASDSFPLPREPRHHARRQPVGAVQSTWGRDDHWKDADER